ncbi:MAG: helix-turn-helix domain-containing protein [Deltaproteobacteria bacterium]|nr:helix-turn-helix domain-containing protein [Deltaproteobacteria bacterium]
MESLLNVHQVAAILNISPHTLRGYVSQGKIKHLKIFRRCLFHPRDIEAFLKACEREPRSRREGAK